MNQKRISGLGMRKVFVVRRDPNLASARELRRAGSFRLSRAIGMNRETRDSSCNIWTLKLVQGIGLNSVLIFFEQGTSAQEIHGLHEVSQKLSWRIYRHSEYCSCHHDTYAH
jgi:hypothetical protein